MASLNFRSSARSMIALRRRHRQIEPGAALAGWASALEALLHMPVSSQVRAAESAMAARATPAEPN